MIKENQLQCKSTYQQNANEGEWVEQYVRHYPEDATDEWGMGLSICAWCKGKIYPEDEYTGV